MRTLTAMPESMHANSAPLRLREAAAMLGVHRDTLRRWAEDGKVPSVATPGGERRYRIEDLDALIAPTIAQAAS